MPFWAWILIDLGILILGLLVLGWIGWDLYFKVTKVSGESLKLQKAVESLQEQLATSAKYAKPADNLSDDPAKLTQSWLARKSDHEHEKSAKQRRLIARFSKRK
jgi:predicted negative regulator of RcsB-dependent stress response